MERPTISQLFDLSGKVALVTGGALGIGQGIALRLADAGAAVMVSDINLETAQETVALIKDHGGRASAVRADVSRPGEIQAMVETTIRQFGQLDILVNNAGIFPFSPLLETPESLWDKVLDVNLKGAFLCAQAAAQHMAARGQGGRIINIASIDAFHPTGSLVAYDSSKGGMVMMTRSLALELGRHGVTVNAVAPGAIRTPGASAAMGGGLTNEQLQAISAGFIARVPLGRQGEPDDIARAVLFLASAAASYMTGDTLIVDGGYLLS